MTRKTLTALAAAGLIALGGVAVAGPASAATCPAGQHWNAIGGAAGYCARDSSGGGTGGPVDTNLGGGTPTYGAPKAPPVKKAPAPPAPVRKAPPAPVKQVKPAAVKVGTVLKAATVSWAKGTVVKYRWTRNGSLIATSVTYKTRSADRGKTIAVTVSGTKAGRTTVKAAGLFSVR